MLEKFGKTAVCTNFGRHIADVQLSQLPRDKADTADHRFTPAPLRETGETQQHHHYLGDMLQLIFSFSTPQPSNKSRTVS